VVEVSGNTPRRDIVHRRDYELVCGQLEAANARVAELTAEVGRLAELVAQSNDRITELLAIAQRKKGGGKKPAAQKPAEPPPSLGQQAQEAFNKRPAPPKLPKKKKPAKKKTKPTGRKSLPDHLEAEEHTVRPEGCSSCGCSDLEIVDEVVEVKLHVVKQHMRKRVVRRKTACCRHCGERTTARSLPAPFARSKATCEWLAWLVHQKFVMLTPLDRIRRGPPTCWGQWTASTGSSFWPAAGWPPTPPG
jgi:transposase